MIHENGNIIAIIPPSEPLTAVFEFTDTDTEPEESAFAVVAWGIQAIDVTEYRRSEEQTVEQRVVPLIWDPAENCVITTEDMASASNVTFLRLEPGTIASTLTASIEH
jgi:hypothetical protein